MYKANHYLKRFVAKPLIAAPLLVLLFFAIQALFVVAYQFDEPKAFAGEKIYNPYTRIAGGKWYAMNLHAHARHWGGLTNGKGTPEEVVAAYEKLGYDIVSVSNYQSIANVQVPASMLYLPTYEHGYAYNKYHQLMIDPQKVSWHEQMIYTTLSQKQEMLKWIKNDAALICFNHPAFTRNHTPEEMKYLKGYSLIEAASGMASSLGYWDSALTAGIPSFVIANDDSHNVRNIDETGRFCTYVYTRELTKEAVIGALSRGENVACTLPQTPGLTVEQKRALLKETPMLRSLTLNNDSIFLALSNKAAAVKFIGQGGETRLDAKDADQVALPFPSDESYLRAEISFDNGVTLYTNPLFRYDTMEDLNTPLAQFHQTDLKVDDGNTFLYRLSCVLVIWLLLFCLRRLWKWGV